MDPSVDAWSAWRAARLHFKKIIGLSSVLSRRYSEQLLFERRCHERAFRWELVAARDVATRNKATKEHAKRLESEPWFRELKEERDFAHESQVSTSHVVYGNPPRVLLTMQAVDSKFQAGFDDLNLFRHYLDRMRHFLATTFPEHGPGLTSLKSKPSRCCWCDGGLTFGYGAVTRARDGSTVRVTEVPMGCCQTCGEVYVPPHVNADIDIILSNEIDEANTGRERPLHDAVPLRPD